MKKKNKKVKLVKKIIKNEFKANSKKIYRFKNKKNTNIVQIIIFISFFVLCFLFYL